MILEVNKDLLLVGLGRIASILLALISVRAVTHFLSPDQYGQLSILFAIQMFCGLFLINPVGQYINLNTHQWWEGKTLLARLKTYWLYVFAVAIFGVFISYFISLYLSIFSSVWYALAAVGAVIFFGTWSATLIPMLNMLGFRGQSIYLGVISMGVGLAFSIALTNFDAGASAWLFGQAVGYAFGAFFAWKTLLKLFGRLRHSAATEKNCHFVDGDVLLRYCLPLAFATGFMWLQMSGYRFLIEKYWGLASLGYMVLGFQVASQVWGLVESLSTQYLYPLFFKRIGDGSDVDSMQQAFSDLLNTLIPIYFVVNGALILGANSLLKILVSDAYLNAIEFVLIGAGIEMCRTLVNLLSNAAHVNKKTGSLTIPYMAGSLSAIFAIYLCAILNFDIGLAAISVLGGAVITLILMWVYMRKQIAFLVDYQRWAIGLAIMAAMGFFSRIVPTAQSYIEALIHLALIALLSFAFLVLLLRHNPAPARLTATKLWGPSK